MGNVYRTPGYIKTQNRQGKNRDGQMSKSCHIVPANAKLGLCESFRYLPVFSFEFRELSHQGSTRFTGPVINLTK
jgi:hypothetical protein